MSYDFPVYSWEYGITLMTNNFRLVYIIADIATSLFEPKFATFHITNVNNDFTIILQYYIFRVTEIFWFFLSFFVLLIMETTYI